MIRLLASVRTVEEAELVLQEGVDIIDLKEPAAGALGALDYATIIRIVRFIDRRRPVSATVGDMPFVPALVLPAVQAMAATGVDYIKIGFFEGDAIATLIALGPILSTAPSLIAVFFADRQPLNLTLIDRLADAGFKGVMIDTVAKTGVSLVDFLPEETLIDFIKSAKTKNLLCGLAGSLRAQHICQLLPLKPDYLGFRGALCERNSRTDRLSRRAIAEIKTQLALVNI